MGKVGAIGNRRLTQGHITTFELGEDGRTSKISKKSAGSKAVNELEVGSHTRKTI